MPSKPSDVAATGAPAAALVLAMPLTVAAGVVGQHVPQALASLRIAGHGSFVTTLSGACETFRKSVESTTFRLLELSRTAAAIGK